MLDAKSSRRGAKRPYIYFPNIFSFEFGPDKNTSVTTQVIRLIITFMLLLCIFTRPFLGNKRDGNADGTYSRN